MTHEQHKQERRDVKYKQQRRQIIILQWLRHENKESTNHVEGANKLLMVTGGLGVGGDAGDLWSMSLLEADRWKGTFKHLSQVTSWSHNQVKVALFSLGVTFGAEGKIFSNLVMAAEQLIV